MEDVEGVIGFIGFIVGCLGVGFFMLRNKIRLHDQEQLRTTSGVATQATIIQLRNTNQPLLFGPEIEATDDMDVTYFVSFEYDAPDKNGTVLHLTCEVIINKSLYDQLTPGQRIPIRYLPTKPTVAQIDHATMSEAGSKVPTAGG